MNWTHMLLKRSSIFVAALMLAGCAMMGGPSAVSVTISGDQEVPAVNTSASGTGTVTVADDRSVSGSFKLQNAAQIAVAHIHTGPAGQNGPVIIPLQKVADNEWAVPPGAKLTEAQYELYKKSGLYVNFHSAKYKGGEIRGQIRP
jgi:CHRD domain-containing protein